MASTETNGQMVRVFSKLKFSLRKAYELDADDTWISPSGLVEVDVSAGDRWTILYEEVRKNGNGPASLVRALKDFPIQKKRTNEMTGTGAVAGFGTPYAFATKEPVSSKRKKKVNEMFESLIVEFRGETPQQYARFLKKHGFRMTEANADASTSISHIVGDLWVQEPTNVYAIVSRLGQWKAGHGRDVQYGSGLANLKSRLSKFFSIRDGVNEGGDPYYGWRNDETRTPKQKIGSAITEINKQLAEVEKVVKRTQRLKKETGTSNNALWNRTNKSLMKIESRMHKISQTIRNMRG